MIFVTVGTHPGQFNRLIKKIDEIAPLIKEEVIVQKGFTSYKPKNVKVFDFAPSLDPYFKKARLVISHSATSLLEFVLYNKEPLITVPRQKKYKEHINDHQVEFALFLEEKTGIKAVLNIEELTPELIKNYNKIAKIDKMNLRSLQNFFKRLFVEYNSLSKKNKA